MNSKLRDIFAEYYHRWVKYGYYGNPEKLDQDTEFNQFDKAIRQAVAEDMLELVGEDEKNPGIRKHIFAETFQGKRNKLRAELRQKIKEYGGLK